METVLITGGSGMIGKHLTGMLLKKGYQVAHLGRSKSKIQGIKSYLWDIEKGEIETEGLTTADYIVHLAGAGIADERWTKKRKQELYESRITSTALLFRLIQDTGRIPKAFIATSAIGYYGNQDDEWLHEENIPGKDFLAKLCVDWEKQSMKFQEAGIRTIINRFGIVLAKEGGALEKMSQPVDFSVAPYLGDGKQFMSWIHIDDLCNIILYEITHSEMRGVYNAVTPAPVSNKEMMKAIIKAKRKSALIIPTPAIALRIVLGEMADTVLSSQRCSADKIMQSGFPFSYSEIAAALDNIYHK